MRKNMSSGGGAGCWSGNQIPECQNSKLGTSWLSSTVWKPPLGFRPSFLRLEMNLLKPLELTLEKVGCGDLAGAIHISAPRDLGMSWCPTLFPMAAAFGERASVSGSTVMCPVLTSARQAHLAPQTPLHLVAGGVFFQSPLP